MLQALRRSRALSAAPLLARTNLAPAQRLERGVATLAFEEVVATPAGTESAADPVRAAIVHGLLGQGRNWRTWGRRLVQAAADSTQRPWSVLLVDQRCHGKSTRLSGSSHFTPPHTLGRSATDIAQLFRAKFGGRGPELLIGHSLGGKVLLNYLAQGATGLPLPKQVWVLDSNPGLLPKDKSDVARVMDEVGDIRMPARSREAVLAHLQNMGFSEGLRLWLGSNLVSDRVTGGLTWTFDLKGARQMYEDYKATEYWRLLGNVPAGVTLNLVRASRSDRWTSAVDENLSAAEDEAADGAGTSAKGTLRVHTLPDAGHWLHVDNPDGLLKMVLSGCPDAAHRKTG